MSEYDRARYAAGGFSSPVEPTAQAIREARKQHPRGLTGLAEALAASCGTSPRAEARLMTRILSGKQKRLYSRTVDRLTTHLPISPNGRL